MPLAGGVFTGPITGTCGYFSCFNATSLSGNSIYLSGVSLLDTFLTINSAISSATTAVQNGLNTYTGGTITMPTVNVSGGTFDNIYVTGPTAVSGLSATTLSVYTGATNAFRVTQEGEVQINGDNGTDSTVGIRQRSFALPTIIDIYNNDFSKLYFRALDNGSAGNLNLGNSAIEIDTYTTNIGMGIVPNTFTKLRVRGNIAGQDVIGASPFVGNGGFAVNATAQNDPYIYLQSSAGTSTQVAIYSSGSSYFNGGNVGFGSTLTAQDAIHIFGGTIRINDVGNTYGAGKVAVSDVNGAISFSAITSLIPFSADTAIQNGLNTYTGGTQLLPTVNISGGTFNNITASGNTILSATSASTIVVPVIYGSNALSGTLAIDSTTNATKGVMTFGAPGGVNNYTFNVGSATTVFTIRERIGATSQGALYLGVAPGSETNTNYTLGYDGTLRFNAQSSTAVIALLHGNTASLVITPTSSVANPFYDLQSRGRSTLTTTSNIPVFNINGSTQSWAAGTVPKQYFNYFRANTMSFASSSTTTFVSSVAIDHTLRGTNTNIINAAALYIPAGSYTSTTTAYGILIDTVTGATNNYGLGVIGDIVTTGNTIHTGGLSAFTTSISGISFMASTGGTPVLNVNTLNGRVGINNPAGTNSLDVGGNINARNSIGQVGGYYINGNRVIEQGPTGYGNSMFVFGGVSSTGYNIFNGNPFGIGTSGASLVLRHSVTIAQASAGYGSIQTFTGSAIVTGVGTTFLTTFNPGDTFRFNATNYTISSIQTDTSLTLSTNALSTSASSTYFVPGSGTRFTIGGNGNVNSTSNSVSGFSISNQTGATPVFSVDTKNMVNSATTVSLTGRIYNAMAPAQIASATTINWSLNNVFDYTLTANTTFTFSSVIPGQTLIVAVRQPYTGATGFNYSFSGSTVFWPGGTTPTATTTTGKTDIYTFVSLSATTVYGSALTNF